MKREWFVWGAFAALLVACGDDVTRNNTTNVTGARTVADLDEAGACDDSSVGEIVLNAKDGGLYVCYDKKWISMKGAVGEPGMEGNDGASCTATPVDGGFRLICDGKEVGTIRNGQDGAPGETGQSCVGRKIDGVGVEISCGGAVIDTIRNGVCTCDDPYNPCDTSAGGSSQGGESSATGMSSSADGTNYSYDAGTVIPEPSWTPPTCTSTGSDIPANDPCVQYFGRWDLTTVPTAPTAAWSATYLKMKFTGTGVSIKLNTSSSIAFYSSIDGGAWTRVDATCDPNTDIESCRNRNFQLATGLAAGTHELAFYRASEGGYGMHDVLGYVVENGTIAVPNAPSARTIECMGNSITAGLGADGVGSEYAHDNTLTAWCVQTALKLGADWSVVAHSGQGMYKNLDQFGGYAGQTEYGHIITMYDEYQWTHYPAWSIVPPHDWSYNAASAREQWHFRDVPDVAIFAIGTNDFINISQNSTVGLMTDAAAKQQAVDEYLAAFKAKYDDFLSFVRSKYPKSRTTIFVHGTILNDDAMQSYTLGNNTLRQLVAERTAAGDDRIFFIDPAGWLTKASDFSGDWTHPTAAGHQIIANNVSAIVRGKMGWQ